MALGSLLSAGEMGVANLSAGQPSKVYLRMEENTRTDYTRAFYVPLLQYSPQPLPVPHHGRRV